MIMHPGQFGAGKAMVWIELMVALCAGGTIGFFGATMFAAGARADENVRHAAAAEVQHLPAVEPLHLVDFDGDAYLGEVASMLRDSAAEKQER
jgi:hypothetical protein